MAWAVERVVHFEAGDFVRDGCVHFGFWDRCGRHIGIAHRAHFLALLDDGGRPAWTAGPAAVFAGVPHIQADLDYPMYADALPDGALVVSSFGSARIHRVDPERRLATILVDGRALGMADIGNCVVDDEATIWANEVTGCRIWRFDAAGRVLERLGSGRPGFQAAPARFDEVRFSWIYDLRRGPEGTLYVLDSRNFALRVVDPGGRSVLTLAGTGRPGYGGDGGSARYARFGGDASARFDGPISLALDEAGNAYIGDRCNHVVRAIDARTGIISTIAGRRDADDELRNDARVSDPRWLNLPQISSLEYHAGRLYVPTDLSGGRGDLAVLRSPAVSD